jgi:hypothetical protein
MIENHLSPLIFSQITNLPFLLVYVAGILLALFRWSNHPKVSAISLGAFGLLLVSLIVKLGFMLWLIGNQESGMGMVQRFVLLRWINLSVVFLELLGWVLLLIALFGWRKSQE